MITKTITVLDPTAKLKVKENPITPRINDINGKRVGFLWNKKANGNLLLLRIKEQLSQKYQLADTKWYEKSSSGVPADKSIIEDMVRTVDVVVNGQGD